MTRFARLQRNKNVGVKIPEEATLWSEFKQQMIEKRNRSQKAEEVSDTTDTVNTTLKLKKNISTSWCEFERKDPLHKKRKLSEGEQECERKDFKEILTHKEKKHIDHFEHKERDVGDNNRMFSKNKLFRFSDGDEEDNKSNSYSKKELCKSRKGVKSDEMDCNEKNQFQDNRNFDDAKPSKRKNQSVDYDNDKQETKFNNGMTLMVNGKDIKITKFDGFYILETDAERIQQLRQKMWNDNRPREEIEGVTRRHRRNAERYLTKLKKKICFNCREGIHNLSECPKLGKDGSDAVPTGICYKCGSTEHTLNQCKMPGNELKYAKCFICNEVGHLSKQCPDNPRGLYPQGGSCRICGDVTHFKRDCPNLIKKKKDNNVTVGTIGDSIEDLGEEAKDRDSKKSSAKNKRVNKIIKFV